jgi:hypothetical protein
LEIFIDLFLLMMKPHYFGVAWLSVCTVCYKKYENKQKEWHPATKPYTPAERMWRGGLS